MNDLMSLGLHRAVEGVRRLAWRGRGRASACSTSRPGSGDLARALGRRVRPGGEVWLTDINRSMLERGRDRLLDAGLLAPAVQCDAERLPFPAAYFDCVTRRLRPAQHDAQGRGARRDGARAQARRQAAWCSSSPGYGSRCEPRTTCTRSRCCRGWASASPATPPPTAISPSRSACIRTRRRSRQCWNTPGFRGSKCFNLAAGVVAVHRGYRI